jgi:hypothetical protein
MSRQPVHHLRRNHHELGAPSGPCEAELYLLTTQIGVADETCTAPHARDAALRHDAITGSDDGDPLADGLDGPGPLVPRDARVPNDGFRHGAMKDIDVRPADSDGRAPHENVARTERRLVEFAKSDLVRPLDYDRPHTPTSGEPCRSW